MIRGTALLAMLLYCAIGAAQERQDADQRANEVPLEPWQLEQILDKPTIAENTFQRLYGLDEAGNPHLKPGTVLEDGVLPRSDEELNEYRRERALKTFASREIDWAAPAEHWGGNRPPAIQSEPEAAGSPPLPRGWWFALAVFGGLFLWRATHRGDSGPPEL